MVRTYLLDALHPGTLVLYLSVMVVLSACVPSFIFTFASLVAALLALALVDGARAAKLAICMEALVVLMAVLTPFFNPLGSTILFTYLGGRPYTLEAVVYGASIALIFAAMIAWFAVMSTIISLDKLAYLFGRTFPKLGFVVISTLTLVPRLLRRAKEMEDPSTRGMSLGKRMTCAGARLMNLLRWAFAEGVQRADVLRSRGFGTGWRTSYVRYRFTFRDILSVALIAALAAIAVVGAVAGDVPMSYFPLFRPGTIDAASILSLAAFGVLALALPAMIGWGCVRWRICAPRI